MNDHAVFVPDANRSYSRAELLSDAIVHVAALVMAVCAVPVLITLTALWQIGLVGTVGVSIYGATLIAMLTASLLHNHVALPNWRSLLRRLDHSAIYIKIAGTYTPFALFAGRGLIILALIWTAAVLASAGHLIDRRRSTRVSVMICLAMGWAVLIGGWDLLGVMPTSVVVLMIAGGLIYSAGTAFLLLSQVKFHNTIWHVFVVAASIMFFVAIFMHAAATA